MKGKNFIIEYKELIWLIEEGSVDLKDEEWKFYVVSTMKKMLDKYYKNNKKTIMKCLNEIIE